jgi:periplasmic protein TonB
MRWLIALPIGLISAFGLFTLMAWMVGSNPTPDSNQAASFKFDLFMVAPKPELTRRQRSLPEPPPPEAPMQTLPTLSTPSSRSSNIVSPDIALPSVDLDIAVAGMPIETPNIPVNNPGLSDPPSLAEHDQQAIPLSRVQPQYPVKALRRNIEGYVVLSFTIDANGRPKDINVVDAKPKHIFEREARRALRRWKYQPKHVAGQGVDQPGQHITIQFTLDKHEN